jgi:hypothetical protein
VHFLPILYPKELWAESEAGSGFQPVAQSYKVVLSWQKIQADLWISF